ncbi:MAG: thiamine pyrophosphate-dependent enzyme [Dehalococcoidia bacterium]
MSYATAASTAPAPPPPASDGYADLRRLMGLMIGDEKHTSSATSTLDVLWVLYDRVLRVDPARVDDDDRDRFLLSKGHGPMAYYAVLAAKGFIDEEALRTWVRYDSPLGLHPDRNLIPGVEISSGSLGHGLPIAVGRALALRARRNLRPRVFCLVGDAEFDEGTNSEAVVAAARLGLDALTAIIVDNQSSSLRWPGGIEQRFAVEGWAATTVDGRDHAALEAALTSPHPGVPLAVVAEVEKKE